MASQELRPLLKLVPTDRIRFHEFPERKRTLKLVERIRQEAFLRNPPIVADMKDGYFLLLDGANRVSAFKELNYTHMPVQVVDYGDASVQLKGWHHLLISGRTLNLREIYGALPGVVLKPVTPSDLSRLLELRQVFSVLVEDEQGYWGLFPKDTTQEVDAHRLIHVQEQVVAAYEGQSRLERIKLADYSQLPDAIPSVEHQLCLFPVLHKEEMLRLAAEGVMIPTGLTRHLIPGRALGINLDLAFLNGALKEEDKQRHFQDFIDKLAMEGHIRFYEESVYIMNE
ncbi:MAG: ParB N-terminal domain-containing protein [Deltaproteobacteria bacterium]|nr:ParB N-terminal domain-containing protein [Deltaproteobacteria bacterium]